MEGVTAQAHVCAKTCNCTSATPEVGDSVKHRGFILNSKRRKMMAAAREVPCFSSEYAWRPARREPHHDRSPRSSGALHGCHWRHEAGQSAAVHVRLAIELLTFASIRC